MPPRITDKQRKAILTLLAQGYDRETIAAQVGVTPGQVSAVAAHVRMGTYEQPGSPDTVVEFSQPETRERIHTLLDEIGAASRKSHDSSNLHRVLIGVDAETDEEVVWNPDPSHGTANPHMLILGESGFEKTYSLYCILTELAQQDTPSIVFLIMDRVLRPDRLLVSLLTMLSQLKSGRAVKALRSIPYSCFPLMCMDLSMWRNGSQILFSASTRGSVYNSMLSFARRYLML